MNVRQRGFSLVELMVAMAISLVLLAGALSILYSSKLTYTETDRLARLQEAGRTVIELMMRDARAAGFMGCSRPVVGDEFVNGLNSPTGLLWNFADPAFGYEAKVGNWAPTLDGTLFPDAVAGSDVLVLRTTRQGMPVFRINNTITAATNINAPISVDRDPNAAIVAGTPMVIADCEGATVFEATAFTPSGSTALIEHSDGAGVPGTNTSDDLARGFVLGAQVMPVQTVMYYVRNSASGNGPALWQKVGTADPVELVQGVQNLQVTYGVDNDGDLLADQYLTAEGVQAAGRWPRVISLSLAVLVRSPEEAGPQPDKATYQLLGVGQGATLGPFNDRRQRAVFATTVVLRNRTS